MRSAEETTRIYGTPDRQDWMRRYPCAICTLIHHRQDSPSVIAHAIGGGTARKADACWTIPLCAQHHDELDGRLVAGGRKTFERKYDVDVRDLSRRVDHEWTLYAVLHQLEF